MTELQLDTLLEATLFGAGRSMSVTELCDSLGYDEDEMLLARLQLAFTVAPRGTTAFCWQFQRTSSFLAKQPKTQRMRIRRKNPVEVFSRIDGEALAAVLVAPSYDVHELLSADEEFDDAEYK